MQYNENTIDDIDYSKKNVFILHDLFVRPIKPNEIEQYKSKN